MLQGILPVNKSLIVINKVEWKPHGSRLIEAFFFLVSRKVIRIFLRGFSFDVECLAGTYTKDQKLTSNWFSGQSFLF